MKEGDKCYCARRDARSLKCLTGKVKNGLCKPCTPPSCFQTDVKIVTVIGILAVLVLIVFFNKAFFVYRNPLNR